MCVHTAIQSTNDNISNKTNGSTNYSVYTNGSTSLPGIVAGAVGGIVTILILIALLIIIGYLTYSYHSYRLSSQSNASELHNDDTISEFEPPPYQSPVHVPAQLATSIPKNALSDPPPSYSSLV